jgi:hypothetical protein
MEAALKYLIDHPDLANALATVFSAFTALIALVVSVWALWVQRSHNKISVRPMPEVTLGDYENSISVKLSNNGVGPLVVNRVLVRNGTEERESIIDWMPALPNARPWTNFAIVEPGRTVKTNGLVPLVELTQEQGEVGFAAIRDSARAALSRLTVTVEYTDVYGSTFSPCTRSLDWFGRNLHNDA